MIGDLAAQLAFLGNFHPIVVHFPLALLPIALALKLWARWRAKPGMNEASDTLLKLTLLFAIFSALLGMINARANGFAMNQIGTHASYAWATILALALALLLPAQGPDSDNWFMKALSAFARGFLVVLAKAWWLLKWGLMILLFPFVLLFMFLRKLYRWSLAKRVNPLMAAVWNRFKMIFSRTLRWLLGFSTYRNWKYLAYTASLLLILFTGLEGGNLVHGQGHLARHAPDWAAELLGEEQLDIDPATFNISFFDTEVAPILRKNCMKCHGEDKAKGDLRLHSVEKIVESGVIHPGSPLESEMIRRVMLSRDDPAAMPPKKNGRGLKAEEIAVLLAWVNGEAADQVAGSANGPAAPKHYVAIAGSLPELSDDHIQELNKHHATVTRLQEDLPLLGVNLQFVEQQKLPVVTKALQSVATHIVELDVSGQSISPELSGLMGSMTNLLRLNLSRTNSDDRLVERLAGLQQLRWLNLFGTAITEKSRRHLDALPQLEKVYLGGTALQPMAISDAGHTESVEETPET